MKYDIATIGLLGDRDSLERKLSSKILFANHETPAIYRSKSLSGVKKNREDLHASPIVKKDPSEGLRLQVSQSVINQTRADAAAVANRIISSYHKKHPRPAAEK